MRHQLRQTRRFQQAGGNASREGLAFAGQNRQTHPQRIARRSVRIVGKRIEEKIGETLARQMLSGRLARREYHSLRPYASCLRFAPQVRHCIGIVLEEP